MGPLFVCPEMLTGGAERQWVTLITALAERGHEPALLTLSRRRAAVRRAGRRREFPPTARGSAAAPTRSGCGARCASPAAARAWWSAAT